MLRNVADYNNSVLARLENKYLEPEEDKPLYECDYCRQHIYTGETYYEMELELLCEDCFEEYVKNYYMKKAGEE